MVTVATTQTSIISISVVSHEQIDLVANLLHDLDQYCHIPFEVILTLNIPEVLTFALNEFSFPVKIIQNAKPKGFAANHNQAFSQTTGAFFCVVNPDIRLQNNPFPELLMSLQDSSVAVVAPLVLNDDEEIEDSARRFPTPLIILGKALGQHQKHDYVIGDQPIFPDWVGGMFMLFSHEIFSMIQGFDERYFMYYEDVDLCARLTLCGYKICLSPKSKVIHQARRTSRRNLRYLGWHLNSMIRFFLSRSFRIIIYGQLVKSLQSCSISKVRGKS